ncbi:MAG TPA: hypothetical protein VFN22_04630 [Gemmatimonadales bacterium]|nr:hypothetical protein [Gemmatimonadales bacterium]
MPRIRIAIFVPIVLLSACAGEGSRGSVSCGLAAMNGPLVALEGFARGRALAAAPGRLPDTLPGRYVAGPAGRVALSRDTNDLIQARFDVPPPERTAPGFGVLIMAERSTPMGIMIHDGAPIPGAARIGTIMVADSSRPLYGVRVTRGEVETPACPLFPSAPAAAPE